MSKRSLVAIALVAIMVTCCSVVWADPSYSPPTTDTKLRITNSSNTNRVLNVDTWGTPAQGDSVTVWSWSNNSTQWWKTDYYTTIGGIPVYKTCLFSDNSLLLNYHQADHHCTLYGVTGNSYTDYTHYWESVNGLYHLVLWNYTRYLGIPNDNLGANCIWYQLQNGPTSQEKWLVTVQT